MNKKKFEENLACLNKAVGLDMREVFNPRTGMFYSMSTLRKKGPSALSKYKGFMSLKGPEHINESFIAMGMMYGSGEREIVQHFLGLRKHRVEARFRKAYRELKNGK